MDERPNHDDDLSPLRSRRLDAWLRGVLRATCAGIAEHGEGLGCDAHLYIWSKWFSRLYR